MTNTIIEQRLAALRDVMRRESIDAFIFPSTDPHNGEYVPEHWEGRKWISGFNGSAGTAVVTMDAAALWTDSRYFLAAAEQLEGTEFKLMKERVEGTPSIIKWLGQKLSFVSSPVVGIDGMVNSEASVAELIAGLRNEGGITVRTNFDPLGQIWTDRPTVPQNKITVHPLEYAGESCASKLERIRAMLKDINACGMLAAALDDIAWTLNLRGSDVHCNPVFVSYLLITSRHATLFVDGAKLDDGVREYLKGEGVDTADYNKVKDALAAYSEYNILLDPCEINHTLFSAVRCEKVAQPSPIPYMKAVKNSAEIEGFRRAMLRDGVVMVKFLKWLTPAVQAGGQTELSISRKLEELRSEQDLFCGNSFDTIAGYAHHGAVVHYEPTPETDLELLPKGLLLLDSGAQYEDGTTDITRTIALGPVNEEERHDYTLVLKGHIRLARAKFPQGCSGTQLDACARYAMWQEGINYLHGTGHGVGSCLCVHEGPHQIRMNYMPSPLLPYMTVTNEPGIYKEGRHGIRIENTQIILPYRETEFGTFLQFDPLTLCPIDMEPIDWSLLDTEEIEWLNRYHSRVYDQLAPLLDHEHRTWLREATRPYEYTKPSQKS